jgi:hypothetical protein
MPSRTATVIPAFAIDWLKQSSATGYLRLSKRANVRMQDGVKLPLLCVQCEQRFAKREKTWAEEVFRPAKAGYLGPFLATEEHRYFALSLAWRTFAVSLWVAPAVKDDPIAQARAARQRPRMEESMGIWREYLLGNRPDPGASESRVFFLTPATSIAPPAS